MSLGTQPPVEVTREASCPKGSSGTFNLANQGLKGWSSRTIYRRIQRKRGFFLICVLAHSSLLINQYIPPSHKPNSVEINPFTLQLFLSCFKRRCWDPNREPSPREGNKLHGCVPTSCTAGHTPENRARISVLLQPSHGDRGF